MTRVSLRGMQLGVPTTRSGVSYITPTDIADLILWYDGLDAATMFADTAGTTPATVGGAVQRWNDKSVSARHATQSGAGIIPTRYSAGGLAFDGNDYLQITDLVTSSANPTVFVVYDAVAFTIESFLLAGPSQGVSSGGTFPGINGYGIFKSVARRANTEPTAKGVVMFKPAMLRRNGAEAVYDGTPGTPVGPYTYRFVGGQTGGTTYHNGRIYEIAVYNRDLTIDEIQSFEAYAINRWGISVS